MDGKADKETSEQTDGRTDRDKRDKSKRSMQANNLRTYRRPALTRVRRAIKEVVKDRGSALMRVENEGGQAVGHGNGQADGQADGQANGQADGRGEARRVSVNEGERRTKGAKEP